MSADDIAAVIGCNEKTVLRARELLEAFLKLWFRSLMRLKASDTGGIWPYEKRLTPRYFIPPQSGPMGVFKKAS